MDAIVRCAWPPGPRIARGMNRHWLTPSCLSLTQATCQSGSHAIPKFSATRRRHAAQSPGGVALPLLCYSAGAAAGNSARGRGKKSAAAKIASAMTDSTMNTARKPPVCACKMAISGTAVALALNDST